MLVTKNLDGTQFNPQLDNYLDLKVVDFMDTDFNDLQALSNLIDACHLDTIVIDADTNSAHIINFYQDIEKLTIIDEKRHSFGSYLTVKKINQCATSDWLDALDALELN